MNEQMTNKQRTNNEQTTKKRRTKDEEKTNKQRTKDEEQYYKSGFLEVYNEYFCYKNNLFF
ncbi:hypothetical protein [Capnocytophaga sp. oral taxon 864]|uniref:hypothetical protein n=1 Tax=Capnocytophaga sp. oral taxon 864 TaxID=1316593 RepID=UPI00101AD0DF|nr:hypothetical protein [Capnocytophaga sp. oral taxon 864]